MVSLISVIIRTKNEEEFIKPCLVSVFNQMYINFEVIVVDNDSTDRTMEIVDEFNCKTITIPEDEWSFGRALNRGIGLSSGEFCALLSGHCTPANSNWLLRLKSHFIDPTVVGVYGRQLPLYNTKDQDKRDLWSFFGIEKKVQKLDPFFHNANSMIRRSVWEKIPFNEEANGLEDRIWAKAVLNGKNKIIYDPKAEVYHPHGLHHGGDQKRAERVVNMIEKYKLHKF